MHFLNLKGFRLGHDEGNHDLSLHRLQSRRNFKIKKKKCPFSVQHSILK